ncbi:hypothetical protein NE619_08415 [Anaerovorax odorimutans]|uniref:Uncharacterized protein n=1 Tax=Anaerovorax odorimutans TaxID=109327 RepID=A0ABT1RNJ3_9FIRM|nr:hypothetical protein [Anaerovorax odorimutans]MCQ4636752.1 hypothetical protein [Anaerovorax odorimutans]
MKQKAVAMATAFTMLLAVGVTGLGSEALHQHPAYTNQSIRLEAQQIPALSAPTEETLLLAAPAQETDK